MKLLLAHPERDLLKSYSRLLTMDGHEVISAFDSAQVSALLKEDAFDLALLGDTLPRLNRDSLLPQARGKSLPVIVLLDERITLRHLLRPDLPEAYLPLPFLPEDLSTVMKQVMEMKSSPDQLTCGDTVLRFSEFRFLASETRLTVQEMDLLRRLNAGEKPEGRRARTLVLALNEKWSGMGARCRITCEYGKGYRLVIQDD